MASERVEGSPARIPEVIITCSEPETPVTEPGTYFVKNGDLKEPEVRIEPPRRRLKQFVLSWNCNYLKTIVGLLRLALMVCCSLSLICLGNAGTTEADVLSLPEISRVRFHIFVCVLSLLISITIVVVEVTSLKRYVPLNWYLVDVSTSFVLGMFCILSSSLMLHSEQAYTGNESPVPLWSKGMLALSSVFGCLCTLICIFLIIFKYFEQVDKLYDA